MLPISKREGILGFDVGASMLVEDEGQLVRVRNRRWLIEEVEEFPVQIGPQHAWFNHSPRVKLACVEDDSAGELLVRLEVDVKFLSRCLWSRTMMGVRDELAWYGD